MTQCAAPAHSGALPLYTITVYHQTAQISTENRVFSDKNSALLCRCCVDFPRKCEKNVFFYSSPVSCFPSFLRKIPGLLCLFSAICCETLHFSVYSCSHEKPQLTHHLTFFIFRNKILQPLNLCIFVIFTSFSSCAACLFAFHQILTLISGFLCSRQLAHNLINYKGTLWTCLDIFQGAA